MAQAAFGHGGAEIDVWVRGISTPATIAGWVRANLWYSR